MSKVTQALVLVGGKATRLRRDGVDVPFTKAFMILEGKPLLYWNLSSIYLSGIREIIIAGSHVKQLHEASKVIKQLPYRFDYVDYFQDEGNGVHGLPYELRYLLCENFLFDCGHGLSTPAHYRRLMKAKGDRIVVFSGYKPHPKNIRQPVHLHEGSVEIVPNAKDAIAHPLVADKQYASSLLRLGFSIENIIQHYCDMKTLRYVANTLPPEYDYAEEMEGAYCKYRQYIVKYMLPPKV